MTDTANACIAVVHFPTLPADWNSGSITGLRAYGGLIIDLSWERDRFHAEFKTERKITFECRGRIISLAPGDTETIDFQKLDPE